MSNERGLERRQIKQIFTVLAPAIAGREDEFKHLSLHYLQGIRDMGRTERKATYAQATPLKGAATFREKAEQARLARIKGERIVSGKDDFVEGGLEVVKGRISVLAWELGVKAPWWLEFVGIKPSSEHPLLRSLKENERDTTEDAREFNQLIVDKSPVLKAQSLQVNVKRELFLAFCSEQAALYPYESVAKMYASIVPDQALTVAERYAQIHGMEEDWLRFFPKLVNDVKRLVGNDQSARRIAQSSLGILWDQLRPENPLQIPERAQRMWSTYLPYMLVSGWSEKDPKIPKPNFPILLKD